MSRGNVRPRVAAMNTRDEFLPVVLLTLAIAGCSLMPSANPSLEQTRGLLAAAHADRRLAQLAPAELAHADDTFRLAESAVSTREDVALADHLAYLARQRLAFAREVARKAAVNAGAAGWNQSSRDADALPQ